MIVISAITVFLFAAHQMLNKGFAFFALESLNIAVSKRLMAWKFFMIRLTIRDQVHSSHSSEMKFSFNFECVRHYTVAKASCLSYFADGFKGLRKHPNCWLQHSVMTE